MPQVYVFNFFTSFGYFAEEREHTAVVRNMATSLRHGGTLVVDYLNVRQAEARLTSDEVLTDRLRKYAMSLRRKSSAVRAWNAGEGWRCARYVRSFGRIGLIMLRRGRTFDPAADRNQSGRKPWERP